MNQQDDKHHTERPFALWDRFFFWNCDHIFSHQSSDAPITNYPSNNMVHMRSLRRLEHWRIVSVYLHQVVSLSVPCFPIEAICRSSSSCTVYITSCRCSVIGPSQDSAMACSSTQGAHNSSSVYQVEWYWCCHCYLGGPRFSTATIPTGISLGSSWIWRRGEFFFIWEVKKGGVWRAPRQPRPLLRMLGHPGPGPLVSIFRLGGLQAQNGSNGSVKPPSLNR